MPSKRFYCYVDETGQDTLGDIFVVTVVIPENRDKVLEYLEDVEIKSGKGKFKWGRAKADKRYLYIRTILLQKKYPLKFYYSYYKDTKEYKTSTILTIFKVLKTINNFAKHKFIILIDALGEKDRRFYGSELHKLGIPSKEVKGVRKEESNALIRLADNICGFIRDVIEAQSENKQLIKLYQTVKKEEILVEV